MPLPPPVAREALHTRRYDIRGYRRQDGLWDIEGHLHDSKSYAFDNAHRGRVEAGEPLHEMWIRLTIDEDFLVRDIEAVTDAGPFAACPTITPNFKRVIGLTIGSGWRRALNERLGGREGCTHLVDMLAALATVAFQTLYPVREARGKTALRPGERPVLIDRCHAFASDGELVRRLWPEHYDGPKG